MTFCSGSLSKAERLQYVNAVKCLQSKPALTPASVATGAKSRAGCRSDPLFQVLANVLQFDDFIVTHIQQTVTIHYTGNFLGWHRWFLYTYEQALRNECGYTDYSPYWDWPKYASAPQNSPIFPGDAYSLGGNGEYIAHNGTVITPPPGVEGNPVVLAPGLGGGSAQTGPFKDMVVNVRPVGLTGIDVGPDGGWGIIPDV